jgi:hypothetical protein
LVQTFACECAARGCKCRNRTSRLWIGSDTFILIQAEAEMVAAVAATVGQAAAVALG